MKILLLQPPFDPTDKLPPLGIASIASSLRAHNYDVQVIDLNLQWRKSLDELVSEARGTRCDVVGLTCWGNMAPFCIEFTKKLKEEDPSIKTVIGGEIATFLSEELLQIGSIDFVVKGEGENTIVDLMEKMGTGDFNKVAGIAYREGEKVISTATRPPANLDNLPFPAWDLFESLDVYQQFQPDRVVPMQASRGCVFNCIFCSVVETWYGIQRRKSPSRVVEEIKYLIDSFGVNCLSFHDDAFTLNEDWVKQVCEELLSQRIEVKWCFNARPDLINDELLSLLEKAGCFRIFYGIESVSTSILKFMRKNIPPEITRKCIRKTIDAGITPYISVIYGFPIETEEEINDLIDACLDFQQEGVEYVNQHILTPYPGTEITARFEKVRIPDPFLKLLRQTLINIDLLRMYPDYVPDLWIFKHFNMTTKQFLKLYLDAFVRVVSKEVFI